MTINLEQQLMDVGALKEGHFLLSSGLHSDRYIEKFDLLRNPTATSQILTPLAEQLRGEEIDVVVGPTTGGILLAFELARQLGKPAAYAERASDGALQRVIKRGTTFPPGSKILAIDDVMTTGGAVMETLAALETHPVEVVAIVVLVDRSRGSVQFGDIPFRPLLSLNVDAWRADECPLCALQKPLVKPGSTAVLAP